MYNPNAPSVSDSPVVDTFSDLTLYNVTVEDAEDISRLEYDLFPENNFNEVTLAREIRKGWGKVIRNWKTGDLVGYLLSRPCTDLLDITRLGIKESYRRQGLASQLLQRAYELHLPCMITVRKTNEPAIQLYKKEGFRIAGTLPRHESWVMRRPTLFSSQ